jgi:hypothetical protein
MEHWVQYHNPDRIGYEYGEGDDEPFSILTGKSAVERLPGNTVWLIAGQGRPRHYTLCEMFVVDEIGRVDEAGFRYVASGSQGTRFVPPVPLGSEVWFRGLLRHTGHFAFGLSRLPDDLVPCLLALHAEAIGGTSDPGTGGGS